MPPIRRLLSIIGLLASSALLAYEEPSYNVLSNNADFEIRQYASYLVVEAPLAGGETKRERNAAFRLLFDYIRGNNQGARSIAMTAPVMQQAVRGEKISMTVPVTSAAAADGSEWMQFVLPSQYTIATAPQPNDARLRLREVPAERLAVRRYSGTSGQRNFRREREALLQALKGADIPVTGTPRFLVYNGPFTPWFARRNEVAVAVVDPAAD